MLIQIPGRRLRQPQHAVRIVESHPLADGLVEAYNLNRFAGRSAVGNATWTRGSSTTAVARPGYYGVGLSQQSSQTAVTVTGSATTALSSILVVSNGVIKTASTRLAIACGAAAAYVGLATTGTMSAFLSSGVRMSGSTVVADNTPVVLGYVTQNANYKGYLNGALDVHVTTGNFGALPAITSINGYAGGASGASDTALVLRWNGRELTADQWAELAKAPWQMFEPDLEPVFFFGTGGGTSVSLTGTEATATPGTLTPAVSIALGGLSVTAAAGTVTPSAGITVALTGVEAAAAAGSLGPEVAAALSGNAASASIGTLTPNAGTVVNLSGVSATASAGSIAPASSVALSGLSATVAVGDVSPQSGTVIALSGLAASAAGGTLSAAVSISLAGQSATSAAGSVAIEGQAQPLAIARAQRQSSGPRRPASISTARR